MRVRFGPFELDEERFLLRREGARIRVRPKVFDLLVHLLRLRDRVVLREELVLALWGTTAIGLGSLSGLVNELRQVLGESGRGPSSIRTVHARGYQFVAPVELLAGGAPEPVGPARHPLSASGPASGGRRRQPLPETIEGPIRFALARASTRGARAVLVEGGTRSARLGLLGSVTGLVSGAGFDVHRVPADLRSDAPPMRLVDRLLGALVEQHGAHAIRSSIPTFDRASLEGDSPAATRHDARPRDPLAARQVDERIWRSAADWVRQLARERPLVFLVEEVDLAAELETPPVSPLLRLFGEARVLLLGTLESIRILASDAAGVLEDDRISRLPLAACERDRFDASDEERGVPPLPRALAEALLAHVRDGGADLEAIAGWLRGATRREQHSGLASPRPEVERTMRKVGPVEGLRRRQGGSG